MFKNSITRQKRNKYGERVDRAYVSGLPDALTTRPAPGSHRRTITALVISAMPSNWARHYLIDHGMSREDAKFIIWQNTDLNSKHVTGNVNKIIQHLNILED